MATTNKGIYYPNNYSNVADVPEDMKKLAESVDTVVGNLDTNKVDKVDGKGLSTNDYTNEDKAKLDSLENYDDTEIKQDIEDIQAKDEAQDTELDKQSDLIQKLKDNCINVTTEEATQLQVTDASTLPAKLDVRGNHSQETTKGIQILENTNDGTTGWGWSTSPSNVGVIKEVSYLGTKACKFSLPENSYAWKFLWRNVNRGKLKNNTTYTIQFDAKTNYNENITIAIQNMAAQNKLVNFGTININGEKRVKVVANSNTIEILDQILYIYADNIANASGRELIITNLILIEGDYSNTDIEWEKYTGLQGSPSLDYPSPVRAVGDNVNILPNNAVSTSHNGVNYTINEDGSIYAVGTATSNSQVILAGQMSSTEEIMKLRKGVQYKNVGNVDIIYRDTNLDYARLQEGNILTVDENVSVGCFYLQVNSGTTVDETYYPKLVEYYEGMDESYSPYGQGSVEVKKINKNYYDVGKSINDYFVTAGSKGATITQYNASNYVECDIIEGIMNIETYNTSGWNWIAKWLKINKNTNYTISLNKSTTSLTVLGFNSVETGITGDVIAELGSTNSKTTFNSGNYEYYAVSFYPPAGLEIAIQVEAGDLNTNFEEHQEQSYILDIQKPMLLGDYFVKEADGWKEVHIWNKLIFTGQENWNKSGASTDEIFVATLDIENGVDGYGYSNYFRYYGYVEIGCFSVYNNGANIRFCVDSSVISDINRFKTMLADKYASGDSVYVYYKLSTPNKLACTEAQSNILDQLSELPLFAGTNNIITAESLALMQMQYIADTETYIDNRIDEKLANINQQLLEIVGGN